MSLDLDCGGEILPGGEYRAVTAIPFALSVLSLSPLPKKVVSQKRNLNNHNHNHNHNHFFPHLHSRSHHFQ